MEYFHLQGFIPLYLSYQQTRTMTGLHYSIISEKMVWIWYYDEFGGKHLKELLADDAVAFVKRMETESTQKVAGTDFLTLRKNAN